MVTLEHQILVDLFRDQPRLAVELLRICAGLDLEPVSCELGSSDLGQTVPTEYRADAVVILRDAKRYAVGAVSVEVQRSIDADKRWTWPVYIAALRANSKCDVTLLVIAPTAGVARWARQPIELGHPHFLLRPIVVATDDIPDAPEGSDELHVLAALAHPDHLDAPAFLETLLRLPDERRRLYFDLVMDVASPSIRAQLETLMPDKYEYRSEFARRHFGEGKEAGYGEGKEAGYAEGRRAAAREAALDFVRKLGNARLGTWSPADEAIIATLDDAALQQLTDRLIAATDAVSARAALDA